MEITNQPVISVIVPIYNSERYLEKCIRSICQQTYSNLEIILINDGSTDNSKKICEDIVKKDTRVTLINIPNGGVSNARNLGLDLATGKFIQFVDSDDFIGKSHTKKLYDVLISNDTELVVCSIKSFDAKGEVLSEWSVKDNVLDFNRVNKELFLELIKKFLLFGPVNKLYVRNVILKNRIIFDTSLSYGEDLLFNFEYFKHIKKLVITDEISYNYVNNNPNSLSKKRYKNKIEISNRIHNVLLQFFIKLKLSDFDSLSVLYNRLFDDYYNEIMLISNDKKNSLSVKYKMIKTLLYINEEELEKSYIYIKHNVYAKWAFFCMKKKIILPFLLRGLL